MAAQQPPYRDFIIAYDGAFIGHYRSGKRVTNRTAFQEVARLLISSIDDFEIGRLQLYKPVPLSVQLPDSIEELAEGAFRWFREHP